MYIPKNKQKIEKRVKAPFIFKGREGSRKKSFLNKYFKKLLKFNSFSYLLSLQYSKVKSNLKDNFNNKIFALSSVIFIFILFFVVNISRVYNSLSFFHKISFPKDNYIDTFLFYSDKNIEELSQFLYENKEYVNESGEEFKPIILSFDEHILKSGETLSHIASKYSITSQTLISFNHIKDVRSLREGMKIKVPNMNGILYKVQKGDSLSIIASKYNISREQIIDTNDLDSPVLSLNQELFIPGANMPQDELQEALGELFIYPTRGVLTSSFGWRPDPFTGIRKFHNGVDLANFLNTKIIAAQAGIVTTVGVHPSYGRYIIISHRNGFQTLYGHLNKYIVFKGERINIGQLIGYMGTTGYSTGVHLHFTIFKYGKPLNPLKYLK